MVVLIINNVVLHNQTLLLCRSVITFGISPPHEKGLVLFTVLTRSNTHHGDDGCDFCCVMFGP